jgi:hypothetical protein
MESRGGSWWRALTEELQSTAALSHDVGAVRALRWTTVDGR